MGLSEQELKRYNRQMMIEGWGEATQRKLKGSTVFIAGAGGLGSPVAIYLAVVGIGNIRICNFYSPDCPTCEGRGSSKRKGLQGWPGLSGRLFYYFFS